MSSEQQPLRTSKEDASMFCCVAAPLRINRGHLVISVWEVQTSLNQVPAANLALGERSGGWHATDAFSLSGPGLPLGTCS